MTVRNRRIAMTALGAAALASPAVAQSDDEQEQGGIPLPQQVRTSDARQYEKRYLREATTAATATTAGATGSTGGGYAGPSTAGCESGGDYGAVSPAGYYGAYQFDQSTWDAYAPAGYVGTNPAEAPPAVQDATAAAVPYDAWPSCP